MRLKKLIFAGLAWAAACLGLAACGADEPDAAPQPGTSAPETETGTTYPAAVAVDVIDYSPAPGQFVNKLPQWQEGMTAADMREAARELLAKGSAVSLGAFGGSITLRLATPIYNVDGEADMLVASNAFAGSAEPGIVEVMADANGNGKPDDGEWLAIAGERLDEARLATVTYSQPAADATDDCYIAWVSVGAGAGEERGWLTRNPMYHTQPFFPQWLEPADMTVVGLRLPSNVTYDESTGFYALAAWQGYADSYADSDSRSGLDLGRAVRVVTGADGAVERLEAMPLARVDFVRVTTGVLGANGALGEMSTEVSGVKALHR